MCVCVHLRMVTTGKEGVRMEEKEEEIGQRREGQCWRVISGQHPFTQNKELAAGMVRAWLARSGCC